MNYRIILCAVLIVGGLLAPYYLSPYLLTLLVPACAYGIALLGLNLLFGFGGLLSLGHALFLAVGAYTAGVLGGKLQVFSFEVQLLAGTAAAALLALLLGSLCVRYSKIYFGMLTLAFSMIFHSFLFKFYNLTGGESGITVPRPSLLGNSFPDVDKVGYLSGPFYWYSFVLLCAVTFLLYRLVKSPFGLSLRAARDNPSKAMFLGVNVKRAQLLAFVISGACGGAGGVIIGISVGVADPEMAYWTQSGNLIFMIILGGLRDFFGPLLGAVVFILLQDELMSITSYWRAALGLLLALIVLFAPTGLFGLIKRGLAKRSSIGVRPSDGKRFLSSPQ